MTINSKNTKAEILAAYKELEKQKKALDSELKKRATISTEVRPEETKKAERTVVNQKNINQTIQLLEQLQTGFGSAVSHLSEKSSIFYE